MQDSNRMQTLELMDPYPLRTSLLCGGNKNPGFLTCPACETECPDGYDCRGSGQKEPGHEMCRHCFRFVMDLQDEYDEFYVYLLSNGRIGMTSNPEERHKQHRRRRKAGIVWLSPAMDKARDAFRREWALKDMLRLAVDGEEYFGDRFESITGLAPSCEVFSNQDYLFPAT